MAAIYGCPGGKSPKFGILPKMEPFEVSQIMKTAAIHFRKRTFHTTTALVAVVAIFLQINVVAVMTVLYSLNEHGIATTVCERKTPACNGKCFLRKQLRESQDDNSSKPATQNEKTSRTSQTSAEYLMSEAEPIEHSATSTATNPDESARLLTGIARTVFNPPRV